MDIEEIWDVDEEGNLIKVGLNLSSRLGQSRGSKKARSKGNIR